MEKRMLFDGLCIGAENVKDFADGQFCDTAGDKQRDQRSSAHIRKSMRECRGDLKYENLRSRVSWEISKTVKWLWK